MPFSADFLRMMLPLIAVLAVAPTAPASPQPDHVDVSTLTGKLVVGFQGWFMCPGDGRPRGGWGHWFTENTPNAAHMHFDLLPDVSELSQRERCPTDLRTVDGQPIFLFSDQNPATVLRQFTWMRQYGISSVALQRFLVGLDTRRPAADLPAVDRVLDNVRTAAERTGRGFFVMYHIVGADPQRWADLLAQDWHRLMAAGVTRSPAYQRHRGRPVLAIAGVGSHDRPGTAAQMADLLARLRRDSAADGGVTLLGATATGWRTLDGDAQQDPAWTTVYRSFDVLSPWTVGRYRDAASFARFRRERLRPDMAEARRHGIDYMPVIFPGFSWRNLFHAVRHVDKPLDEIPRLCGDFLNMQAEAATGDGATMLYGAMFDEVDEGTALFKLVPDRAGLPANAPAIALDEDGCRMGSDGYLRIAGEIGRKLRR
jgi:hypothetical protein